jgi:hypothetical protein
VSADMLRKAAALMRDKADAAVGARWQWVVTEDRHWCVVLAYPGTADEERVAQCADDDNAAYIAAWPPAVALAVADWLDGLAICLASPSMGAQPVAAEIANALAVAHAYLGGTP